MTTPTIDASAARRAWLAELARVARERAAEQMRREVTQPTVRPDQFRGQHPGGPGAGTQDPQQVAVQAIAQTLQVPPERVTQLVPPERLQAIVGDAQTLMSVGAPEQATTALSDALMRDPAHLQTMTQAIYAGTFNESAPPELTQSPFFQQLSQAVTQGQVPSADVVGYLRSRFEGTDAQGAQWAVQAGLPTQAVPFDASAFAADPGTATDAVGGPGGGAAGAGQAGPVTEPTQAESFAASGPGGTPGATPGGAPGTETANMAAAIQDAMATNFAHVPDAYPGDTAPGAAIAQWMAKKAVQAGLPPELPVMAALVESQMTNIQGGDRDSMGYFQMRTGIWNKGKYAGYPQDPEKQMQWFIDTALQVRAKGGFNNGDTSRYGEWIADIERPAAQYRGRYQPQLDRARELLQGRAGLEPTDPNKLGSSVGSVAGSSGGGSSAAGGATSGGGAYSGGAGGGDGSPSSVSGGTNSPTQVPSGNAQDLDVGATTAARNAGLDLNFFAKMMKSLFEFSKWMEENQGKSLAAVLENNPAFQAWVLKKTGKPLEKGKVTKELVNAFMAEQIGALDISKGGTLDLNALATSTAAGVNNGRVVLEALNNKLGLGLDLSKFDASQTPAGLDINSLLTAAATGTDPSSGGLSGRMLEQPGEEDSELQNIVGAQQANQPIRG